jgi:hypothetical protein
MKNKIDNQDLTFYVDTHCHAEKIARDSVESLVCHNKVNP